MATIGKNKYQELDDAICKHLLEGRGHPTNSSALEMLGESLLDKTKACTTPAWRLIDRRMQAMRKAGRIGYGPRPDGKRGWTVYDV